MQLELPWRDERTLQRELELLSGLELTITLTDNTSTMMSMKRKRAGSPTRLRLHRMFLEANAQVVRALASWLTRVRCDRAADTLNAFIRENRHQIAAKPPRRTVQRHGVFRRDLRAMYDEVNAEYFGGTVDAPIIWGRQPTRRNRRSIRFGSYTQEEHLIRIHPFLDDPFVPEFFVRYIVFHEMLHAYLGVDETENGRRRIHTPEFKRMEKAYPDYDRAVDWLNDMTNLRRLLRAPRQAA